MLSNLAVFQLMDSKLHYNQQRQGVLAQNVANADTPNYRPRDLVAFDFRTALTQAQQPVEPVRTHKAHMAFPVPQPGGPGRVEVERNNFDTNPDGNAVSVEDQMMRVTETAMDYGKMLQLYRKNVGLVRMALGSSGR